MSIEKLFGAEHTGTDEYGSLAISNEVRYRFDKLWKGIADWDRHERCWRMKDTTDRRPRYTQQNALVNAGALLCPL
jgi:hypothetical protein